MVSPRWMKLLRDLRMTRGRMMMMVLAIALGIFGVGTIFNAYTILNREISRNYLGTHPASALLEMNHVDDALIQSVRQQPGIAKAEAGSIILSRIETKPNEWTPILLFVVKDFNTMQLNTFQKEYGAWPPPKGTMLIERAALSLLHAKTGDALYVQTPNGIKRKVTISGVVHDPGLAPAWQEQTAYGYITPSTMEWLGENSTLHVMKILVANQPMNEASIEHTVSKLSGWLSQQGYSVNEIRIPPPGKHPHQSQMDAILFMLLIFSLMALALSAVLTATMIGELLAQQIRQIGVMKAIGARSWQIASLYLTLIVFMGLIAFLLGLAPGIYTGRGLAKMVAELLNFNLYSLAIPGWVYVIQLIVGIFIPFVIALFPILRTTRITVLKAISDFGTSRKTYGSRKLDTLFGKIRVLDRSMLLTLRNTFRKRGRLLLTLSLLAAAGGLFMTSLNVKTAWEYNLKDAASHRHYDLEMRLTQPESSQKVQNILAQIPEVQQIEAWNMVPAGIYRSDGLDVVRTYPDGGHGSFTVRSLPEGTSMIQWSLLSGRLLNPQDANGVVLNNMAQAMLPGVKVGDTIQLTIRHHPVSLRVVGIIREVITPATAYVIPDTFAKATHQIGQTNTLRIVMKDHSPETVKTITNNIEQALEKGNIHVKMSITEFMLDQAQSGHVYILIFSLIFMSVLMALVGELGLMSAMGTSVVERTREFGVMRSIGGKSSMVLRNVIGEGVLIGLMSWVLSLIISLPLSLAIGRLIGNLAFHTPLPLTLSPAAMVIWLGTIMVGSITASAFPAWKASKLTIRETLTYN